MNKLSVTKLLTSLFTTGALLLAPAANANQVKNNVNIEQVTNSGLILDLNPGKATFEFYCIPGSPSKEEVEKHVDYNANYRIIYYDRGAGYRGKIIEEGAGVFLGELIMDKRYSGNLEPSEFC